MVVVRELALGLGLGMAMELALAWVLELEGQAESARGAAAAELAAAKEFEALPPAAEAIEDAAAMAEAAAAQQHLRSLLPSTLHKRLSASSHSVRPLARGSKSSSSASRTLKQRLWRRRRLETRGALSWH